MDSRKRLVPALLTLLWPLVCPAGELEMKTHRFQRHGAKDFERLVLEFRRASGSRPEVTSATDGAAGEMSVRVSGMTLRGAIPEAAINDSYVEKSRYLGALSVNPEADGFTVRAYLKEPSTQIAAFWLDRPGRLVIDAYPPSSPRARGLGGLFRDVAGSGHTAARGARNFVCYPAAAAVGMKVSFRSRQGRNVETMSYALEGGPRAADGDEAIVCFPRDSQVVAAISFVKDPAPTARTVPGGAPANRYHNQSPQSEGSLPLGSAAPAPLFPPLEGNRAPTAGKPSLNLPLSLPPLPQSNSDPATRLALPPEGQNNPGLLLPPVAK